MTVNPLIVLVITHPLCFPPIRCPDATLQIKYPCKFLGTFAHPSPVGLDFLVHVLGVGLLLNPAQGLVWVLTERMGWQVGLLGGGLGGRRWAVKPLLVGFLVLGVVYDLIRGHFDLFQNVLLVGLRLNLNSLIYHITKLPVPLIQLLVPLNQCLIPGRV